MKLIYKYYILFLSILIIQINKTILLIAKFVKVKKYLNICLSEINNEKKFIFHFNITNPKISVVIPVFNCEKTIKYSIRSIQNQKLTDFEILLINDFSKDKSLTIIKDIQMNDSRIIIINNNENKGILYSRNIGVLLSRGKYIFPLDNDDMFANEYIFKRIYKEAQKYNYDIIGFECIDGKNYNPTLNEIFDDPFINNKENRIIYQPNLKFLSFINNDCHLWGKCIKKEIYKKAINSLGKKRNSIYLCYAEDDVMIFMIYKLSNSYKFTKKYGLFHIISNNTASFYLSKDHIIFSKIFFLDIIFDFTDENIKDKEYVYLNAVKYKNKFFSRYPLNDKNKKYLKYLLIFLVL